MKIAYLMQSTREYDELIETINQLVRQGDHVFVMINDNDLRGKVHFVYAEDRKVHISETQEFAQEGDLSLARGTIIQMKEALEMDDFDYFINLTDGMIPIKPRSEIVQFLEEYYGKDFYYVDRDESEDPNLRKKTLKYYTFTNLLSFPTGKFVRWFTKANATFLNVFGLRRKLEDSIAIGSPWFMLTKDSAQKLANVFDYVSTTYKLSWYPEEMYIPMMMQKYVHQSRDSEQHVNKDYRVVGPQGDWIEGQGAKDLTSEVLCKHPEALFGGRITAEKDTLHIYNDYFDKYNEGYVKSQDVIEKEQKMIDPDVFNSNRKKQTNKE